MIQKKEQYNTPKSSVDANDANDMRSKKLK